MVASLLSIMLIIKAINAQEQYELTAEDICFDSTAFTTGYEFSPPFDGEIIGIRLQHKSGAVNCYGAAAGSSHWGCNPFSTRIYVEMIKHDVPTAITYYPTATTDGASGFYDNLDLVDCDCSYAFYFLDGYDGFSPFIELRDSNNLKQVSTSDTFSIQYGEGCCEYGSSDNVGTACADVYFIYSTSVVTNDPSRDPTPSPSREPTPAPSKSPITVNPSSAPSESPLTVNPSSKPTTDPSSGPAPNPSEGPTRNYLTTTSDGEATQLTLSIVINSCVKPQDEESNCNITKNSVNEILVAYLDSNVQISSVVLVDNTATVIISIPMSEYRTELDKEAIAKETEAAFKTKYDDVDVTVEDNDNADKQEDSEDINDIISDLMANELAPLAVAVMIGVLIFVCFVCLYFCRVRKKKRKVTETQDMMAVEGMSAVEHTQQATNAQPQSNQVDLQSIISTRAKLQSTPATGKKATNVVLGEEHSEGTDDDTDNESIYDQCDTVTVGGDTVTGGGDATAGDTVRELKKMNSEELYVNYGTSNDNCTRGDTNGATTGYLEGEEDRNRFAEWKALKILNWILSIENGVFKAYEHSLTRELFKGQLKGEDLILFDLDDFITLGIDRFEHRKLLKQNILKYVGDLTKDQ
eukprot:380873_1